MTNLMSKYPNPNLNFRLEIDFDVAISKEHHKNFEQSYGLNEDGTEADAKATPVSNSAQIGIIIDNDLVIKNWKEFIAAWEKEKPDAPNAGSGSDPEPKDYDTADSWDTQASGSFDSMRSVVHYLRDHLNHELPHSPETAPLIAPVLLAEDAKTFDSDKFYLGIDYSTQSSREEFFLLLESEAPPPNTKMPVQPPIPESGDDSNETLLALIEYYRMYHEAIESIAQAKTDRLRHTKRMWRVGGIELVSPVFQFNDRASWLPKLQEVQDRLTTLNERAFFPLGQDNMLHVHVGIDGDKSLGLDSPLGLLCMKNVLALYALFEDEIGRWFPIDRRNDNNWAKRVRVGQELFEQEDTASTTRYTPQALTEAIYAQRNVPDLRAATNRGNATGRNLTVHISPQGRNKSTTIEFRQHQGTVDASSIRWWSTFVCQLVKFAYFLAQMGVEIHDHDDILNYALGPQNYSFVEELSKTSILDLVGLSPQGKQHFASVAAKYQDDKQDAMRELDLFIIKERSKLARETGVLPTDWSDDILRATQEYAQEKQRVMNEYNVNGLDKTYTARYLGIDR